MIGRIEEQKELNRIYNRDQSDLVAVYGRRRVGKTYLVNETFRGKFAFRHTGLSPKKDVDPKTGKEEMTTMKDQLTHFHMSLQLHGAKKGTAPANWEEAFFMLEKLLMEKDNGSKQVVFFDELPWMDTKKSGFLQAFEGFYNGWCSARNNVMVIVCASASSWILNKLIRGRGGLFNRVTCQIKLSPFSLKECEEYLESQNIRFSRYDIAQSYMIFGGIPYYLGYVRGELSMAQNADKMFFNERPLLKGEYQNLFACSFEMPDRTKKVAEYLFSRNYGYTRREISEKFKDISGTDLTKILLALEESDFVIKYIPFGQGKRDIHYRLTDPYCRSYLSFIEGKDFRENFWQHNMDSNILNTWKGIAFENVCYLHFQQILKALNINGIEASQTIWNKGKDDNSEGAQIDLIISRADNVLNLCELKFYSGEFLVDAKYEEKMRTRNRLISERVSRKKVVRNTLITTYGLTRNGYSNIFTNIITLDDLFE